MSKPFHINVQGERLCATYEVKGSHIDVQSAYGSRRAVLGLAKPERMAKALLRVILRDVVQITPALPASAVRRTSRLHLN